MKELEFFITAFKGGEPIQERVLISRSHSCAINEVETDAKA